MLGLRKARSEPISFENALNSVKNELAQNAIDEQNTLSAIGSVTDPLAELALKHIEFMPVAERELFLKSVLQRLVFQTLHVTADEVAYPKRDIEVQNAIARLDGNPLFDYGTGVSGYSNVGGIERAVITESIPEYIQVELIFKGE